MSRTKRTARLLVIGLLALAAAAPMAHASPRTPAPKPTDPGLGARTLVPTLLADSSQTRSGYWTGYWVYDLSTGRWRWVWVWVWTSGTQTS